MKKPIHKISILIIVLLLILSIGSLSLAEGIGDDVIEGLKSKDGGMMGDGAMNTISKLSNDIFNVVRYIVIAYLIIKAFSFLSQFSNAGDQPALKAGLKTKMLWTTVGLVIALNFWSIYNFIATSIQITFD